jgi:uncharacterized protein YPO0396
MHVIDQFTAPLVAALAVFIVEWLSRGRFRSLERRIDQTDARLEAFRTEVMSEFRQLRTELAATRSELSHELAATRSDLGRELAATRSDLTRVALAIGLHAEPEAG